MTNNQLHLPKLNDLVKEEHKSINYLNYTNEKYNILTFENHNEYYQHYSYRIPVYVHDQPNWNNSSYKKKAKKITPFNYILYRNAKNIKEKKLMHNKSQSIPKGSLYKELNQDDPINNQLPKIRNGLCEKETPKKVINRKQLRNYKNLNKCKGVLYNTLDNSKMENSPLNKDEQLLKRTDQLVRFSQGIKSNEGKSLAKFYSKRIVDTLDVNNKTKEQLKVIIDTPLENLEKDVNEKLKIKSDINDKKESNKE